MRPEPTHLPYEFLDGLVDGIGPELEFRGDPLCLLCQCHAAHSVRVECTGEVDLGGGLGTDGRGFIEGGRVRAVDRRCNVPRVDGGGGGGGGEETEDLVRQVRGYEELENKH